jgi:hypothetical protein
MVMMAKGIRELANHVPIGIELTHYASAVFIEE